MTHPNLIDPSELIDYSGPPLYLFVGISTEGSSVHQAFPLWAPILAPNGVLRGVNLPEDSEPERFRELVTNMRDNPHVMGAVVTSHKLRLYRAVSDLVEADAFVELTHEINSLDTRDGIRAFARDAQSLDVVLDTTATDSPDPRRPFICIGAGGSAIALLLAMSLDVQKTLDTGSVSRPTLANRRGSLSIVGRRQQSLDEIADVCHRIGLDRSEIDLILASTPDHVSEITRAAERSTVVANSTGLGKTSPGSPLPGPAAFAPHTVAWDFNYRGPLTFLEQARQATSVRTEDGWDYFLAGWSAALAAVGQLEFTPGLLNEVRTASVPLRP